ncbi:MAG: hypothetical protein RMK29_05785 [Myxococcales bacterium]|nr:hypothetical protein [Myxococcota bacterium]MDW8281201.1 hypothetical protein [Myxococcales bacterium]
MGSVRCALLLLWLPACLASSREEIIRISRELNNDLRWGRLEHVLPRMGPKLRAHVQDQLAQLGEDLEFLDHEVTGIELGRGPGGTERAVCRVELSWSDRRSGLVQRATVVQHWELIGRQWLLVRMVRARGASLPLFEEPPPVPPPAPGSQEPQRQPHQGDRGVKPG